MTEEPRRQVRYLCRFDPCRDNATLVTEAVSNDGRALQYASENLRRAAWHYVWLLGFVIFCPGFFLQSILSMALSQMKRCSCAWNIPATYLAGGLEDFYFPIHIGNVIIPFDFHIFQRGRWTTNQLRNLTHSRRTISLWWRHWSRIQRPRQAEKRLAQPLIS